MVGLSLSLALGGCSGAGDEGDVAAAEPLEETSASIQQFERHTLIGDIVEYSLIVPVGPAPTDRIRINRVVREKAPFQPRHTSAAVMMLHGDFSTFNSNFVGSSGPGLAIHLAAQNIDVWGIDRRWTLLPADTTDFSSLQNQGFALAIDDTAKGIALARAIRAAGGDGAGQMDLLGFSRGAQIAYAYASAEAVKPAALRQVKALIPLDMYYRLSQSDDDLRQVACTNYQYDQEILASGQYEQDNRSFWSFAQLSRDKPNKDSPYFEGYTNRQALLAFQSQTYFLFNPTPYYHLAGGSFDDNDMPTGLLYSPLDRTTDWFLNATPFQSYLEEADGDAVWCGTSPPPVADHLEAITIPVYAVGAAGGFGEPARYTTQVLGSSDVTFQLYRSLPVGEELTDLGHADLLFGNDAPSLVWTPLASWILAH